MLVSGESFAGIESTVWHNLVVELVKTNPGHRFVMVPHKKNTNPPLLPNIALSQPFFAGLPLLKTFRRQFVLNRLIRYHQVSLLIAVDDFPPAVSVPAVFLLGDKAVKKLVKKGKPNGRFAKAIQYARTIMVSSQFSKNLLLQHLNINGEKIEVCGVPAPEAFKPFGREEKQAIKEKFTDGREYFLYSGPLNASHPVIALLKAFSLFKKRQMSNMQLLMAGHIIGHTLQEKLSTYKYRADVQLIEPASEGETAALVASAYTCVNPYTETGLSANHLQAICSAVPVISCSDAEPFCQCIVHCHQDAEAIADKMKLIYKDENYRNTLAYDALHIAGNYKNEVLVKKLSVAIGLADSSS